jgi:hypothetical protein
MEQNINELTINGVKYYSQIKEKETSFNENGLKYVLIRGDRSGAFAGFLKEKSEDSKRVILTKSRRLWAWYGAASLSQLAIEGVKRPKECKFPCEMHTQEITDVIEIIDCTEQAFNSIKSVPVWSA